MSLKIYFQNKSHVKLNKTYTSIAVQCKLGNDLDRTDFIGDEILLESKAKLDITVGNDDIYSQTEEFKTSLNKLDNLINTLSEIQSLYKTKTLKCSELILNSTNKVGDSENNKNVLTFQEKEQLLKLNSKIELVNNLSEEEILKFNINFDENTFIQCHTNRGKHSLKIIQNSGHKNYNPLILHRCESELLLTKNIDPICKSEFGNRKSSSEMCCQIQGSYHTLSAKFGNLLNLSLFKKNLVEHMANIKEDVKTLRNMLYSIECLTKKEAMPVLPIYVREIRKWFSERETEIMYNIGGDNLRNDVVKLEDSRYVEAKIRATNFCKFYTLTKSRKTKSKWKKYKKNSN